MPLSDTDTTPLPTVAALKSRRLQEPLYERLANFLLKEIAQGRLKPGDRLPTEAELSAAHGISRVPVRQALDMLRREGLIERFPSRGTFVTQQSVTQTWTLRSVDDLARLGDETELHVLDWREMAPPPLAAAFFGAACASVFRLRATRARHGVTVFYMEGFMAPELGRAVLRDDLARHSQIELFEQTLGVRVERALEEIGATAATADSARRLSVPLGSPLLAQDVKLLGARGRPLQVSAGIWRADAFRRCYDLARG